MARNVRSEYGVGLRDETGAGTSSILKNLGLIGASAEGIRGIFAGLASGLSLAAITAGLKSIVNKGDDFRDLSRQINATVEQVSGLDFIAGQSGASVSALAGASAKLSKNLSDIARGKGKDAADALKLLGINAEEFSKLDFATQLGQLADGLNKIENPAQRTATAQALLGRGARQLASLMREGSKGIDQMYDSLARVNGVITTAQGAKFDALNDSIGLLKAAATGAGAALAEELAPGLTRFFNAIAEGIPTLGPFSEYLGKKLSGDIDKFKLKLAELDLAMAKRRETFFGIFGKDQSFRTKAAQAEVDRLKEVIVKSETDIDKFFEDQFRKYTELRDKLRSASPTSEFEGAGDDTATQKRLDAQQKYLDTLRQQFIVMNDTSELAKVIADTTTGSAKEFSKETIEQAKALADGLDFLKETSEVHEYLVTLAKQRLQVDEEITKQYDKERAALIENLQTPLEKYISTIENLRTFNLSDDVFQRGVRKANDELISAQKNTAKTTDLAKELGLTFTSAFEDAVVEMRSFGDVFKALINDITRVLIRKSITEPFTNWIGGLFGSGGSGSSGTDLMSSIGKWFGGLFGNASGGLYRVGGSGSEHTVAFKAQAGEYVAVGQPGNGEGGGVNVHIYQGSEPVKTRSRNNGRDLDVFIGSSFGNNVEGGRMMPYGIRPSLANRS